MRHNEDRYRELKLFLAVALAGIVAALNHVHIPYTEVLIDGRWAFGFMGFALLRRWWAALALAALLSYPYGSPDIPLWIGFGGNMLYAVPTLLTLRPLSHWMLRRWGAGWLYGLGWLALVLLCYQAFMTPVVWGVSAILADWSATAGILEGWRTQPFLVESILVALFSAAALVAVLAVERLRSQRRRLEHINRVLLGIRNVNQLIVKEDDPRRLIEKACVNLTETMGYHNAWIALLGGPVGRGLGLPETGPVAATAAAGFDGGFENLRERLDRGVFPDCMDRALESGDTLVVDDPADVCADCSLHGECAGIARTLAFDGVTYGILTASVPGDYAQDSEEQALFNEVASDLAFALHKIAAKAARENALAALGRNHVMMARTEAISHVGSWEWDIAGDRVRWSDELFRIFGRDPDLGAPSFAQHPEIYLPEDMERLRKAVERCMSQGTPYQLELRAIRSDGEIRHCVSRGQAETDENGRIVRLAGSLQDITERKQAEEALADRQALLTAIYRNAPLVMMVVDGERRIRQVNGFATQFAGRPAEEMLGLHGGEALRCLHALDDPQGCGFGEYCRQCVIRNTVLHTLETGETHLQVEVPYSFQSADGEIQKMTLLCSTTPLDMGEESLALVILQDITERKRAEEALLESERRFKRMLDVVPDMISIHSSEMDILYSNWQGFAAIPEDKRIPNTKCYRTYRGLDNLCPDCRARTVLETRKPLQKEVQLPDGRWVDLRAIPLLDQDDNVEMFVEWVRDITDRKQAEEALRRSEERFRRAIAEAPFPAMIHAEDGEVVFINAEWKRVTGYRHDEIPTIEAWTEKAYGAHQGAVREVIAGTHEATGHTNEGDFEIRCRDGSTCIWTFRSTSLDTDERGRHLALSMAVDITEQVYAREKRERLATQISTQARQMQAILDTVPQGVVLLDSDGRILHINPVAKKELAVLTGSSRQNPGAGVQKGDELTHLGERPLAELLTSPPVKGLWHEVLSGESTFEIIARPVEQGPEPERWVLVIKDVTRERKVHAQLQRQERLAAVGQLAGGIAHDFNNIMAVIILYAGMVAQSEELTERDQEKVTIIGEQSRHAARLIEQILDFSRQAVLKQRPLDLLPLLKEQVKLLARTLPEHIEITLAHGEEEYMIGADPTRMQQMMMNLALNARDAMPGGGTLYIGLDKIEVQPGASPLLPEMEAGEWVRLTVSDTGTGIAPNVLSRIFDPFFTTKAPGEGTGLGLAQVDGIVGQHEGRIGVETAVEKGTTFTVYLPALTERPVEPPTPDVSNIPRGQGETVLVVEDQAAVRAALVDTLEQMNYQALEAANGEQALAVMQAHGEQIALVVSDVVMPVMGGVRLLHALRQQGWETPVILLTGHVVGEDLDKLHVQGLSTWLPKPPDVEQLARAIAGALAK